ncbi:hypothetical protein [Rheinheimera metallidurans]|uniref:hypothetical protein n=1 Tax=Rheinheimera metallidurans TaxID=2925781 RepID=UPI003002F3D6
MQLKDWGNEKPNATQQSKADDVIDYNRLYWTIVWAILTAVGILFVISSIFSVLFLSAVLKLLPS